MKLAAFLLLTASLITGSRSQKCLCPDKSGDEAGGVYSIPAGQTVCVAPKAYTTPAGEQETAEVAQLREEVRSQAEEIARLESERSTMQKILLNYSTSAITLLNRFDSMAEVIARQAARMETLEKQLQEKCNPGVIASPTEEGEESNQLQAKPKPRSRPPPDAIAQTRNKDCLQVYKSGRRKSGPYIINPPGETTQTMVWCDQETEGGGWTVVQRRLNGEVNFNRNWTEYVQGFGYVDTEFWLGLKHLHSFTTANRYALRIELYDWDDNMAYAEYSSFKVGSDMQRYKLQVEGYKGTVGDVISGDRYNSNNQPFSTRNYDNAASCANYRGGGWWFNQMCGYSNLNGIYYERSDGNFNNRIYWATVAYRIKRTEMKIKPSA
ncbi:ANGPT2 [Branchiostoma lanceolatum]|uniref:ANGPT2 protein n=1 Tax=Branchiostoma lanceolatum TaxID=7740 RepID=A0A8J9ZY15_BRALA|nr:ANGPT2 [Branchiostoma lanceolatum]